MNSIHEAIRKFRPDLKLDGWTAPKRPLLAAAAYPEFIKPEMVVRGLATSNPAEPGASRRAPEPNKRASAWRPITSLALVFALAIAFGAGLALRPAKLGRVEARTAPERQTTATPNTTAATLAEPLMKNIPAQAAPAVVVVKPQTENSNETGTVKLAAIPKHSLAPMRKPAEYVSLQPRFVIPPPGGILARLTPVVAAATVPTTSVTIAAKIENKPAAQVSTLPTTSTILAAMQPETPAPEPVNVAQAPSAVNGDIPEILYEADSPQTVPASTGELAAPPVAAVKTARPAAQVSAPAPASNGNRIQGIFWDKQRPMALLGDNIVEVGSETPLGKVVVIEKNYVVFERDGKRISIAP